MDNVFVFEKKAASNDGYIVNGDFETGTMEGLSPSQSTCVSRDAAKDGNFGLKMMGNGGWGGVGLWTINGLEAGATYKFEMDMNAIASGFNWTLWQDSTNSGSKYASGYFSTTEWTHIEKEFVANSSVAVLNINGGGNGNAETVYLDNLKITLVKAAHTCEFVGVQTQAPTCGVAGVMTYTCSCGDSYTEEIAATGAHEFFNDCETVCIICYQEVREANHNIVHVEAVAATCDAMGNLEFWYCDVCGAAWLDEACTLNTNMMAVKLPAGHVYDDNCDSECDVCGEWRFDAPHNLTYVPGVVPANCLEEGYDEYWKCVDCKAYFGDAEASWQVNPGWMYYTGDCTRPEGSIPCAVVECTVCGNDVYGEACTRPENAPVCQDAECVYCGETVWGWGCNYNTGDEEIPAPLCQPGDCVYCGTHYEKLYDCENGSWAPCSYDGECAYGCGKQYAATGEHVFEEGVTACDGGLCWLCWNEIEAADHVYSNEFDTTCNVCDAERAVVAPVIDVKMSISEDVNGLAFRFEANVAGFAVKAGTFVQADYTNATYNGYKLIETGVVASNGASTVTIKGERMCDLDENGKALFAYRIVNIPADKLDVEITMTPYYIVEIDGEIVTIEGNAVIGAYAEIAIG